MAEIVTVTGLKELEIQLQALGEEYGPKAAFSPIRSALGKAAKVVQADAQSRVHKKTGTLAENIIVTTYKNPPDGEIGVKVTVRARAKGYSTKSARSLSRNIRLGRIGLEYNFYGPLFYGGFLEFGTSHQPAYPFMRPAFEANKSTLANLIRDELAKAIIVSMKRLTKQ